MLPGWKKFACLNASDMRFVGLIRRIGVPGGRHLYDDDVGDPRLGCVAAHRPSAQGSPLPVPPPIMGHQRLLTIFVK
jgi:hypothetical protein